MSTATDRTDTKAKRLRLAVVVSHPIQYYAPLYRELASRHNLDLHVVYLSDGGSVAQYDVGFGREVRWDIPLLDGYDHTVLKPGIALAKLGFWRRHDKKLSTTLSRLTPDWVLVYGYASRMNWAAVLWARRNGAQVAYTSDSNVHNPRRKYIQLIKRLIVGQFFDMVGAFLAPSEANREYLLLHGAAENRIHRYPFAVDVQRFGNGAPPIGAARPFHFIWAGKFTGIKRPQDFVAAVARVHRITGLPVRACMVGDGALKADVAAAVAALPRTCTVEFMGFVNQFAMPAALHAADVLVFTSEQEAYGLVATEAAAAGLALVIADRIGCVGPTVLAQKGVNALTYRAGDVNALAEAMTQLLIDPAKLFRMQRASRAIASEHSVASAAAKIEYVLSLGRSAQTPGNCGCAVADELRRCRS